jgi:hypothetical protein
MAEQLEQAKHPGGRPRLTFDLRQVEDLGKIQSTHAELAAVLGCGLSTIKDRLSNDSEFSAAYERGREAGKSSLRRIQWKAALAGNVVMQIWLGKQYLGQRDQQAVEVTRNTDDAGWDGLLLTDEGIEAQSRLLEAMARVHELLREQGGQITEGQVVELPALPTPERPASEEGTA